MTTRTKLIRVRQPTYDKLITKKLNMEKNLRDLIGRQQKVKMIDLMDLLSQKQMFIQDNELRTFFNKHRRKQERLNLL